MSSPDRCRWRAAAALPTEVARYDTSVRRRLLVKPGLTGLWQISGRSDLSWEEAVRLDLRYVENWSFAMDAMILWTGSSDQLRGLLSREVARCEGSPVRGRRLPARGSSASTTGDAVRARRDPRSRCRAPMTERT